MWRWRKWRSSSRKCEIQSQAENHVNQQTAEMERWMRIQTENLEKEYAGRLDRQVKEHQAEMLEIRPAQMDGFSLVGENSQ